MDRQAVKPPFAYYGGKTTLAPVIADLLPAHEHYVEPFAGSLAVLLAKKPSRAETVNDLDGDIVTFWRVLRDRPDELERLCALTPHARDEWSTSKRAPSGDELERARQVWVLLTQSRSNSTSAQGWRFRQGAGGTTPMPETISAYARRITACADRLRGVTLENRDAIELIRDYGRYESVCIYVDPPYLGSTRASGYGVEMLGDDAHIALADALNECKASVVLSGYDAPLYAELFDGWHRMDLAAPTTLSGDTDRVEVLWSNVPLGDQGLFGLLDGGAA